MKPLAAILLLCAVAIYAAQPKPLPAKPLPVVYRTNLVVQFGPFIVRKNNAIVTNFPAQSVDISMLNTDKITAAWQGKTTAVVNP